MAVRFQELRGRSIIQAMDKVKRIARKTREKWCVLVTVDVQNAFNTAIWEDILEELRVEGIPGYLRKVLAEYLSQR